ncbi:hypothetical protein P7C73_g2347, partial [Tremellales sp. Uapishka_1]
MRMPWKKEKVVEVDPATGAEPMEHNALEKSLGLGKVGTIFASGSALFSDGYANASIGPVNTILKGYIYKDTFLTHTQDSSLISAMAFAGIIVGQLTFGWISDKIGRKFGMLVCTGIVFVFSALEAGSKGVGGAQGTINALIAYRFLVGIGIGGEYPTGSVAAAEGSEDPQISKKSQQRLFVLATNSAIDVAFVVATFVPLVLLWIFGMDHLRAVWRITLGLGIVPPMFLLYFRLKMREPEAYIKNSMKKARIPYWLIIKRYWVKLAAVSITWFIYDWITYPFGIYSSAITDVADANGDLYSALGWSCLINVFYLAAWNAYRRLCGRLPRSQGEWPFVAWFMSLPVTHQYCMITGLLLQALFGFILSGCYNLLVPNHIAGFAVMYGIFLSFGELGPGNCLGLLASKAIGPTATRGQLYGIAAAVGKGEHGCDGGWVVELIERFVQSARSSGPTRSPKSRRVSGNTALMLATLSGVFWIGSALAVLSALITFLFIPNIKADHMVNEDIAFREYLVANGYDVTNMGFAEMEDPNILEKNLDEKHTVKAI